MKAIFKFIVGCFCIGTAIVFLTNFAIENDEKSERFTINTDITYNTIPLFNTSHAWVYGNYVLERQTTLKTYSSTRIDPVTGTQTEGKSYSEEVFTSYTLSNIRTRKFYTYSDSSLTNPRVKSVGELADKHASLQFVDEADQVSPYLERFKFLKDSIVNNKLVSLLVCDFKDKPNEKHITRLVLYLDKSLKAFPFPLISKTLNQKFGGTVFHMSAFDPTGKSMNVNFDVKPSLTPQMEATIKKFIAAVQN